MAENQYTYVIVGAGLAGASAAKSIRENDSVQSILLIGEEKHLPYHRPPLSKGLWTGTKTVQSIMVEDSDFYSDNRIDTHLSDPVVALDAQDKVVTTRGGERFGFQKLLLATGGIPKKLPIPGGDHPDICYFRYLDDFERAQGLANEAEKALVIGGGFIGSEIAASLSKKTAVTMVYPEPTICARVFPESLGQAVQDMYTERGIDIVHEDSPETIEKKSGRFVTTTRSGKEIVSDMIVAGIGIKPNIDLAEQARLKTGDGIVVDDYFQTSDPVIYAAGDNAFFPYKSIGPRRIEHWDAALSQGAHAGRVMAGENEPFTYLPYFFSDLFDFGYEAVGKTDPRLETFADWEKENEIGVVYYLKDAVVQGALMCNVWDKVPQAREMIQKKEKVTPDALKGKLR